QSVERRDHDLGAEARAAPRLEGPEVNREGPWILAGRGNRIVARIRPRDVDAAAVVGGGGVSPVQGGDGRAPRLTRRVRHTRDAGGSEVIDEASEVDLEVVVVADFV